MKKNKVKRRYNTRDFIYDTSDIWVALIIIAAIAVVIFWRINVIMDYPDKVMAKANMSTTELSEANDKEAAINATKDVQKMVIEHKTKTSDAEAIENTTDDATKEATEAEKNNKSDSKTDTKSDSKTDTKTDSDKNSDKDSDAKSNSKTNADSDFDDIDTSYLGNAKEGINHAIDTYNSINGLFDADGKLKQTTSINIPTGSLMEAEDALVKAKLFESRSDFEKTCKSADVKADNIKAGKFTLEKGMTKAQIAKRVTTYS